MKPLESKLLHKFYGCEEYSCRSAFVYLNPDGFYKVDCFIDNKSENLLVIKDKTEQYAENAAENWVTGIGL